MFLIICSILFYPVYFIILYAVGEYVFPTRNSAMIFAFCGAFLCSFLYYTIRSKVSQLNKRKSKIKLRKESHLTGLMLIDEKEFKDIFPDALADNSYNGLHEETLLEYLRKNGVYNHIDIYSIKGMSQGCRDLLALLKVPYKEHSVNEIIDKTLDIEIPKVSVKIKNKPFYRLLKGLFSREFQKFAIKYGVILILLSIITPYKLYYIIFGGSLILFGIVLKILRKFNLQNQIPYLQS